MELLSGILLLLGVGRLIKSLFSPRETDPSVLFGEPMCKCYNVPSGKIDVLRAGPLVIKAEVGPHTARFRCGPNLVQTKWRGSVAKMIWRLVGQDGLSEPHRMERQPDGTYLVTWTFDEPTCWCGPEGHHSRGPETCQAVYRTKEMTLEFTILKEASSSRPGWN